METVLGQEFWEKLFRERFEKEKVELVRQVEEKVTCEVERKNLVELFSARLGVTLTEEEEVLLGGHLQRVGFSTIFRIGLNITGEKELREWLVTFDSSTS